MEKKYVVKDFEAQTYYCGDAYGWSKESYLAQYFYSIDDAVMIIERENGKFQIQLIYVI